MSAVPAAQTRPMLDRAAVRQVGIVLALMCLGVAIVWLRRPSALTAPQFWAEDGRDWYADAYNEGPLHALFTPYAGYLSLFPRAVGGVTCLFSLSTAALIMAATAVALQAATFCYLLSKRFADGVGSRRTGGVIAVAYLLLPNSDEVASNLTNSQWHLAFLGAAVLASAAPRNRWQAGFDVAVVALMVLTGPFAILVALPFGALWVARRRIAGARHRNVLLAIIVLGCLVQLAYIVGGERRAALSGLTPLVVGVIYGKQVVLGGLLGKGAVDLSTSDLTAASIAIVAALAAAAALVRAPGGLSMLVGFGLLAYGVALPSTTGAADGWSVLQIPGIAQRYWMLPSLGLLCSVAWLAFGVRGPVRWMGRAVLCAAVIGMVVDFSHPALPAIDYEPYQAQMRTALTGQSVSIPVQPNFVMRIDGRCQPGQAPADCTR